MVHRHDEFSTDGPVGRRTVLRTIGAAGAAVLGSGTVAARERSKGFPQEGITEWSDPVSLGNGALRTFTSVTPSGEPRRHGVYLEESALTGLPSGAELAERAASGDAGDKYGPDGEAVQIHGAWSQEFFVPIPRTAATPFTFLGLTWNPAGHPPPGIYDSPHFDVHFHMEEPAFVDAIEGLVPATYELPDERIPDGYVRLPEPELDGEYAVVTDMGEHLADPTSPELAGEAEFTNTLIWGAYDTDGDGVGETTFVEPMLTKAFLEGVEATEHYDIAQPAAYPKPGAYPQRYSVRRVPADDAIAIAIDDFQTAAETYDGSR